MTALALCAGDGAAQTAEELVAKYVSAIGGADTIQKITTLRRSGVMKDGSDAPILQENKRPDKVREEYTTQGLTGITAYDGATAWKISPWEGKKDPEPLGEEELRGILEDADFDGPLVDFARKGNTVEYAGHEDVEGTDTYKLKVRLRNGDVQYFYLDAEYCIPIRIDIQRTVRGSKHEYETYPGDYKKVSGWYQPFSVEGNAKGSQSRWKVIYRSMQANIPIDDARFARPGAATQPHQ
ncbi:MAG TPA: hypothetical protein VF889_07190 [Bacteroidota bacterium]